MSGEPTKEESREGGLGLAVRLASEKKYGEAKQVLTDLLELNPNDAEAMCWLSEVFLVQGRHPEAKSWLDRALSIDPHFPRALYDMGVVYTDKKQWTKAIRMYEKAIKHYPADDRYGIAAAYQNLGCALWEDRRRMEALEAWKACLRYDPENGQALGNLKEFTNGYGLPASPAGPAMDDVQAFQYFKIEEYFAAKGRSGVDGMAEAERVITKIMGAWNDNIASKYGRKLDEMTTEKKVELFKATVVPWGDSHRASGKSRRLRQGSPGDRHERN